MKRLPVLLAALLFPVITSVWAGPPFPPPGNIAAQVAALQQAVAELQGALVAETAARQAAEARIAAIEGNTILQLDGKLLRVVDDSGYVTARFEGVNVQIVNGQGATNSINGVGNLILGYNQIAPPPEGPVVFCSNGQYARQDECEANGFIFTNSLKTGSHNLVVGDYNNYSQYAGIVAGRSNTINGIRAVVLGGHENIASGGGSAILGGESNRARGEGGSVSGGFQNVASGEFFSSVSGGSTNTASGNYSSVLGGNRQEATTIYQTIPTLP
ncbi:MAG TPA: hypothetical protein VN277_07465 [Acidiferrobacterales bacterium]|nr:hypothetical protein [Acidiferrobacterales bacterium]